MLLYESFNSCASQNLSSKPKSTFRRTFLIFSAAFLTQSIERNLLIASFTLMDEE